MKKNIINKIKNKKKNKEIKENLEEDLECSSPEIEKIKKITNLKHSETIKYLLNLIDKQQNRKIDLSLVSEIIEERFKDNDTIRILVEMINKFYGEFISFKRNSEKITEIQDLRMNELENLIHVIQSNHTHSAINNDTINISNDSSENL